MANFRKRPREFKFKKKPTTGEPEVIRVRTPKEGDFIGLVTQVHSSRFRVECTDDKERMCRIPGRLKRKITLRQGDVVIVEPWEIQGDIKGDIIWKYHLNQVNWLRQHHYLDDLEV